MRSGMVYPFFHDVGFSEESRIGWEEGRDVPGETCNVQSTYFDTRDYFVGF